MVGQSISGGKNASLSGCITALVTPLDSILQVDYEGLKKNIQFQLEGGVSGLVPLGTTGESPTMSSEEFEKIVTTVVTEVAGRVPVIVGTGTNSTDRTIEKTKKAEELGADAALIVTPYYNKPTQEGIYRHFEKISRSSSLPIIVYNIAGRTGVNITTETMLRLSKLEHIVGVKEASGSISQMMDVLEQLPKEFIVLSGDDGMTVPLISMGGRGVISVVSNLLPRRVSEMVGAALSGDVRRAAALHYELMPIFRAAFIETNPIPIKTAMTLAGMPAGGFRLPLCEMQKQNIDKLRAALAQYQELSIKS